MADQTERIIIEIDGSGVKGEAQQVERAINTIGDAADKTGKKVTTAEKSINELGGALKTTGSSAKTTERDFQSLQSTIGNARPAQAQADALKQVANSAKQSASEMANLGRTAGGGVGQIRGITSAATPAATAMSSLSGAAGLLVRTLPLVGGAVAAINLTGLISQSTQLAARYETLGVVMNVVGKNAGYTSAEMERFDKSLQKTGISMAESRNNLAKMAMANIDLANASKLARIAQDAAVIGNMNSSQVFQSLIYGIQSAQVEVLRTIGLNVNFEQSYKKLADQLGKTSNELTETEKTQARLNAVMDKAPSIAGAYEASLETVGKKLGSAERLAENAKTMLGALFLPTWTAAVDAYYEALVRVNEELEKIDVGKAERLGRALVHIFTAPNPGSTTLTGFAFNLWQNYEAEAKAANVTVKKSFTDTWGEIERAGMKSANTFIASEEQRKATIQKANDEILESFRKLNQTQIDKLDEQRESFLKAGASKADVDKWYNAERAKLEEAATKKHSAELKKQVSEAKKARAEMLKDGKSAEHAIADYWDQYEKRRIAAIADSAARTVKLRVDAEKEAADAATAILEKQQADAQKVMDRIQEGTADVFYDMFQDIGKGWETLWTGMKDWALRTIAELAAKAATMHIVVPILTTITGTSTANAAVSALTGGGASGLNLSSLSSLVQPGSLLSKIPGFGAISSLLATQLPGTTMLSGGALALQSGLTAGGDVASLAAAQNLAGMTGGLSLGSALGMGAIGGLGYSMLGPSIGLPQNQWSGLTASLGGALGAWGGTALASSAALAGTGMAAGAAMGSVIPVVGTAVGALAGGLLSSAFGKKEHSPSVIFGKNKTAWGQTDGYKFHTKDGASWDTGKQIAGALGQVAGTTFAQVEALLNAIGSGYVDQLKDATVTWGRKSGGLWGAWDFGADHNFEKLFAKAAADLQKQIYKAAAPVISQAGSDYLGSSAVTDAYALMADGAAQFDAITKIIRQGVQKGDLETYATQLQSFQLAIATVSQTWEAVSQASAELVTPLTQYEQAQRQLNAQYDIWIAQLEALGFAQENIKKIEEDRTAALAKMAEDNAAALAKMAEDNAAALAKYRQSLIVGQDSALPLSARLAASQAEYDRVSRMAWAGDQDAAGNLSSVANQWLELSKESAKTQEDYGRTFGDVLRRVDLIVDKLSGKNVPGFAAGGFFAGGLRIVGENGPEMEATGPSRIWSASETRALLSGGDSGASVEIRALREEVRAIGSALARNTMDMAKMFRRWDGNGMPEVRA